MGRNRNDYRENERGQSQDTQNLRSHLNAPLQSSLSAPTLRRVGIVRMSPGKPIGIARIAAAVHWALPSQQETQAKPDSGQEDRSPTALPVRRATARWLFLAPCS